MRNLSEMKGDSYPPSELIHEKRAGLMWWLFEGYGMWYNISLIMPPLVFVLFLLSQLRRSVNKLTHSRSYIMGTYYAFLWVVAVLNLVWCLLQVWQAHPGQATAWNVFSLVTRFGMLLLEVSVVVFLLQGNHVSGWDALIRTLILSGLIASVDATFKAVYIFGFGVPLFIDNDDVGDWQKWVFWLVHKLLLVAVYATILCMPHTKWRDRLPARPAFYNYICAMFLLNATAALGCGLLASGVGFGYWIYGFTNICYHSFYPPFLYATFLADFFQEEDVHLEDVYYSEMKDAGFFDADWD
eukprot:Gb_04541 [translate_table: standard]